MSDVGRRKSLQLPSAKPSQPDVHIAVPNALRRPRESHPSALPAAPVVRHGVPETVTEWGEGSGHL
jgi:hypothetical protein